jgi:hypothetical protein
MVTEDENPDSKECNRETFLIVDCLVRFRHVPNGRAGL